jgi:diacylglycerol kinase (ATP)
MSNKAELATLNRAFSIRSRLKSFRFAGRGLRWLVQDEHNAWLHLAASIVVVGAGLLLEISLSEWRWLVLSIALVWLAEAFNTALEDLCDHISPDFHVAIGRVKDLAAGAVLVASIAAALIGLSTLLPPLIDKVL